MSQNVAGILIFYKYQNKFGITITDAILITRTTHCVLNICRVNPTHAKTTKLACV